ncbi:MAG: CDP-glucose 4,6-dehydratase, partial [Cytophagales bacterium]
MIEFEKLFKGVYKGKKVLVTGHTGFKGSWLVFWLKKMGAEVHGFSIGIPSEPSHYWLLKENISETFGDIKDFDKLKTCFENTKPDIVFHLAAQSLVKQSYYNPIETIQTNVMGTAHVMMAAFKEQSTKALVNITSDKCYENKEWIWGYRENEAMGGYDPYSASKGCAELIHAALNRSFFNNSDKLVASCRAGNVIGGGDWAADRIMPDLFTKAAINQETLIRNPLATRPWQHVLEPLSGYLLVGQQLLENKKQTAESWNFGPEVSGNQTVAQLIEECQKHWSDVKIKQDETTHPHEAK